jgi:hypothetical protein
MWFSHPNPAKLAEANDLHGLVNCVTGKDLKVARQAVPILAALVDDLDGAPGTHDTIRDLESDAGPMAIEALVGVLRHDFGRSTQVKKDAALALYHLHAVEQVKSVVGEVRDSPHRGEALHATLSRVLLGAAVHARDAETARFLLANGHFTDPAQTAAAQEMLGGAGGTAAAAAPASPSPATGG